MKLIDSSIEPLIQEQGLRGIYKQIEKCGRTCYKSEDKIIEDSCERFVNAMIKSNHTAMLEHGTVYLTIPVEPNNTPVRYIQNPYSKVKMELDENGKWAYFVTTNYRVIIQHNWTDDLVYLSEPTAFHEKRYTFRITCNRIQSQSICRHRKFSFAQESTRYCNYSKDKFGHEIQYVPPVNYTGNAEYESLLKHAEDTYFKLIEQGWKAESARDVLPNALKTEICVTGFKSDWDYFLDLRYRGTTGKPHPDMYVIAKQINDILYADPGDNREV